MQEQIKGLLQEGENLRTQDLVMQQRRFELENLVDVRSMATVQRRLRSVGGGNGRLDSLEMDQYDGFHGVAHTYIEAVADSRAMTSRLIQKVQEFDGLLAQQQQLNSELQQNVMSTRMIPVEKVAARLQRSVRQACRATGKRVVLEIKGADIQLDGDVLNKSTGPLMHLLRNAVDHGIESPQVRQELGKPAEGTVGLHFTREWSGTDDFRSRKCEHQ